jgi:DNA-binding transcriptional LysR family regulator
VRLTPGGRNFLPGARRALSEAAGAIARARDARSTGDGPLIIAVSAPELRGPLLRRILVAYRHALPDLRVHIEAMGAAAQWDALHRRAVDVGLAYSGNTHEHLRLVATPILQDAFDGIVVSAKSRFARRKQVHLRELAHERLILPDRVINPEVHDLVIRAFHMVGFVPREFVTDPKMAVNSAPATTLVAAGHGWGLAPSSTRYELPVDVRYVRLADFAVPVTLQVMHRVDDRSIRVRTLVRIARQVGAALSGRPASAAHRHAASARVAG